MSKNPMKVRSIALACALVGAATWANAQDVDSRLVTYKAATAEVNAIMAKITDAASANANKAALEAALAKQRAAEAALNAESQKLKLSDKKDGEKMEAVMTEQAKANEAMSAQQMRLLQKKDTGEVVGKSFGGPTPAKQ